MAEAGVRYALGVCVQLVALCPEPHPSRFLIERFAVRSVQLFLQRGSLAISYVSSLKQLGLSHGVGILLGTVLWPDTSVTTENVLSTLDTVAESNRARDEFMEEDICRFHTLDRVNPLIHVLCILTSFIMLLEVVITRLVSVDVVVALLFLIVWQSAGHMLDYDGDEGAGGYDAELYMEAFLYEQDWIRTYRLTSAISCIYVCVSIVFTSIAPCSYLIAREGLLFYVHGLLRELALRSKYYRERVDSISVRIRCRQVSIAASAAMLASSPLPLSWAKFFVTNTCALAFYGVWSVLSFDPTLGVRPMEFVRTRARIHERTALRLSAAMGYLLTVTACELHYRGLLDRQEFRAAQNRGASALYFHCLVGLGVCYQLRSTAQSTAVASKVPRRLKEVLAVSNEYLRSVCLLFVRANSLLLLAHLWKAQLALTAVTTVLIIWLYVTVRTKKKWFEQGSPERYAIALVLAGMAGAYQHQQRLREQDLPQDLVGFTSSLVTEIPQTIMLYVLSGVI